MNKNELNQVVITDMGENIKNGRRWGCLTLSLSHFMVMGLTAAGMLLYWYMPSYLGGILLPRLAALAGIKGINAEVRELGLTGATFDKVKLELGGSRVIAADSIRVEYQLPFWPVQHGIKLKALEISGARVKIVKDGGVWRIPGIYPELFEKKAAVQKKPQAPSADADTLDLKYVALSRCILLIEIDKVRTEIPFTIRMKNPGGPEKKITGSCKVQCAGDVFRGQGEWYRHSGRFEFKFNSSVNLESYLFVLPRAEGITGKAAFTGEVFGEIDSAGLQQLTGTVKFSRLQAGASGWMLTNPAKDSPSILRVKQNDGNIEYSLSNLALTGPVTLLLDKISGKASLTAEAISVKGDIASRIDAANKQVLQFKTSLPLTHQYELNWNRLKQRGHWNYSAAPELPPGVEMAEAGIGTGMLRFKTLKIGGSGDINCNPDAGEDDLNMNLEIAAAPAAEFETAGAGKGAKPLKVVVDAPHAGISAGKSKGQWHGGVNLAAAGISLAELQFKTGRLKVELPLLHLAAPGEAGRIQLQQISLRGNPLLDIDLAVKDIESGLLVEGRLNPLILPGADWNCRVVLQLKPAFAGRFELNFGPYDLSQPLLPGKYLAQLEDTSFSGNIAGSAEYRFGPAGSSGMASLHVAKGVFKSTPLNLTAEGIEAILVLPGLPELRTPPLQVLSCKSLQIGTVNMGNLKAEYQIEPGSAFLLENFSANWCGGRIYTQAMRITPGQRNLKAVVYCDGLILSQLLAEMGIAQAAGAGSIQGRMPVSIGEQGIVLEPGYLYSEPGDSHNLRVKGMDKMLEGLPPDSVQFSQMDIAAEALKNFDYEWVKINFANVGEALRLEMQLNGRPAEPLPFKYDGQRGGFVRVNGEKAIFQGIKLDINTNIPLNQMLKFNNNVKKLFGGKKT
ncbi:MAG: YdbH domain-containing protein [Victivallaceae bacterium]|jgi:hypothetical protein